MSTFNLEHARKHLQQFNFAALFIEELGWEQPAQSKPDTLTVQGETYTRRQVAQLAGVVVFELTAPTGQMPEAKTRAAVQQAVTEQYYENLLIFVDAPRTQSVWYWVKRDGSKRYPRSHYFVKGQTGDLFLSKISAMFVDMSELDEAGNLPVVAVAGRMKAALDIERVTKKFFDEFQLAHAQFLGHIGGIPDERERRWYTSVILNRVMFIWFLQFKGFIDRGDRHYLSRKLEASRSVAANQYYPHFLQTLFFEGFARPEAQRADAAKKLLGQVKYLNGGLFLPHPIEDKYGPRIIIPDVAFEELYRLFGRYSWSLDDTVGGRDDEINPDVLGHIFEKYINQKEFGAYYTRPEITEYLCEQTIHKLVLDKLAEANPPLPGLPASPPFETIGDIFTRLDAPRAGQLLHHILPNLSLLDPACGSGAFLVAAMKTLVDIYQGVIGRIEFLPDEGLKQWLAAERKKHPSLDYFIKKRVITHNLYGVDIMAEAVEIARLRLFLALVASARTVDDLEPLPNIDFNILPGNSLIGLLRVDEQAFNRHTPPPRSQPVQGTQLGLLPDHATQLGLFSAGRAATYQETVAEKNRLVTIYQDAATYNTAELQTLRDNILAQRHKANATLNKILLDEFGELKIMFEQATWDDKKNAEGKPKKRPLTLADMEALQPFHWGYEFDEVMNERGGFDAIITNPPWEIFKPIAKEFCYDYDPEIERRGTDIKDFKDRLNKLLQNPQVREQYLAYQSKFPHVSDYFRAAHQFKNQVAIINDRRTGADVNLYKLFLEQCFNLLREDGSCGIVIPSSIYSDLGATALRKMLFEQTRISGLFGMENRKRIFEGVDMRFKIVILSFQKGGQTRQFPATFMRHDVAELAGFPAANSIPIDVDLLHKLSPGSLSVMEFTDKLDVQIAKKMIRFPGLGDKLPNSWNLSFTREFDMTNDSGSFKTGPSTNRMTLYEGKMIWHYEHGLSEPRYWIEEKEVINKLQPPREREIKKLLHEAGASEKFNHKEIRLGHQYYRLGYRAVTGATNERALVVTVIPKNVIAGNSLIVSIPVFDAVVEKKWVQKRNYSDQELLVMTSLMASFVCDWFIRQKILTNMNMFYVYQLPVPRLTTADPGFAPIVARAAQLICTTPEFDDLVRELAETGLF